MPLDSPISRRDALRVGAAAMTGVAVTADSTRAAETDPGWIDAHSHVWTRDVAKFPLAKGQTVADLVPPSFTDAELLRTAEPVGVRRVVLIQHHIYHGWDNSYLIDAATRAPDRFRVVGMLDDTATDPARMLRELAKRHVTGLRITPRIRGREKWLDGDGMAALWRTAVETKQAMCCLIDPDDLPAVDRMCERFPETNVVIDHFARIGADGTIRDDDVATLCRLAKRPRTFVKISAYYALGRKQPPYLDLIPMIRRLFEAYGPQRLMWASDAPYQLQGGHDYAASLALVRDRLDFVSNDDKQWLLRKTAERVYFDRP